mmetsp:Transcript_58595/g.65551  ORF Transcript_58595/g.65551 Transcript_58595/m.65551 type:complete len:218 (+) Transcript_58595:77-730(+)
MKLSSTTCVLSCVLSAVILSKEQCIAAMTTSTRAYKEKKGKKSKDNKSSEKANICANPMEAVKKTLDCIEKEDLACAMAGYSPDFTKIHNGIKDETAIGLDQPEFWGGAFFVVDLGLVYNFENQFDENRISIRYIESVRTLDVSNYFIPGLGNGPTAKEIFQHEHALITVDGDCKMVEWDQYGDNKEQTDVGVFVGATAPYLEQYGACLAGPDPASC